MRRSCRPLGILRSMAVTDMVNHLYSQNSRNIWCEEYLVCVMDNSRSRACLPCKIAIEYIYCLLENSTNVLDIDFGSHRYCNSALAARTVAPQIPYLPLPLTSHTAAGLQRQSEKHWSHMLPSDSEQLHKHVLKRRHQMTRMNQTLGRLYRN